MVFLKQTTRYFNVKITSTSIFDNKQHRHAGHDDSVYNCRFLMAELLLQRNFNGVGGHPVLSPIDGT